MLIEKSKVNKMKKLTKLQESGLKKIVKHLQEADDIGFDTKDDAKMEFRKQLVVLCKQASLSLGDDFVKSELLSTSKRF